MQAIIHQKYGSPENLRLENIPKPKPRANQVLVKIIATGVNSWDGDMVLGRPLIYRLLFGLLRPRYKIIGCDVAGVVEEVGSGVRRFRPGDRVFGDLSDAGWGGYAEYVATNETALTNIPAGVTFEQAAALSQAGLLTLQSLRFNGKIKPGDKVLFNGAGGGVGTLGLQLAKQWGAEVTVVDHGDKLTRLKELGADHLLDYRKEDYTQGGPYDLVVDVVTNKSSKAYEKVIKPGGGMAVVGGRVKTLIEIGLRGGRFLKKSNKKIGIMGQKYRLEDLDYLASRVAQGTLEPVIGHLYTLPETPEAIRAIIKGTGFGKLVVQVAENSDDC
jgi:NADPH:quinone reductase-like Zn-dependent oxidoreductase